MSSIVIHSPASGKLVGEVPVTSADDVRATVARARAAQKAWGARSVAERAEVLFRVRERLLARTDEVVDLLTRESGKPRQEALLHEVMEVADAITYFAGDAQRILAPQPISLHLLKHRASYLHWTPRGVVGIIGPWNFPLTLVYGGVIMALMCGNAVVVKPSEFTPLIAKLGREIFLDGGVPEDLLGIVYGRGDVGAALIDGGVDMIEFTGSVATGRKVAAMCGERLIPCVTELGGKAPALILQDADLERALHASTWGGFANNGQVCASIERLLVHQEVYDKFVPRFVEKVKALRVGDPATGDEVDVGPLVNARQRDIVAARVADAVARGATVACGGHAIDGPGNFYAPTVLLDCTPEMDVMNQETFGPVVPVMKLPTEAAMVEEANRSHLGLLAYVFTRDTDRGRRVAETIAAGTVMVNDVLASHAMPETPWGGVKASGIGHTHGDDAMRHMCEQRHVNYDLLPWMKRELWHFPYRAADIPRFKAALKVVFHRAVSRLLVA
jgi:succinate-semialdehyde dehydrogenase/glutarate-semialdehyde dehydrogenase